MTPPEADVAVVGAGPAGAATAALLAARGHDVVVLDRSPFPREKACAEYLGPGTVDLLEGLGVLDRLAGAPAARPAGIAVSRGGARTLVTYDEGRRPALGIRRPALDDAVLAVARDAGARTEHRVRVLGTVVEDGRVRGVRAVRDGVEGTIRARVVVGADGLHSAVARSLGLDRPLRWPRRLGLVARYRIDPAPRAAEMHVGDRAYCGIGPVDGGHATVSLVVPLEAKPAGERTAHFFERTVGSLPGAARTLAGAERVTRVLGAAPLARRVRRVSGPGFLLVGDAAGFLDPLTGEGVYRALRGAHLAAEAAERALARPDGLPTGYAEARRREFRDKERLCLLVQGFLASGRLFEYGLRRLQRRRPTARLLFDVLGDTRPAAAAFAPGYVVALLRP
jgi:menaquinone-9 beta-reductase